MTAYTCAAHVLLGRPTVCQAPPVRSVAITQAGPGGVITADYVLCVFHAAVLRRRLDEAEA